MISALVDGNALMWRAAYGMGTANHGVTAGILNLLCDAISCVRPDNLTVFWDEGKSRWRTLCYPQYKAHRAEKRKEDDIDIEEVFSQSKEAQRLLNYHNVRQICVVGVEADDLIAWFSEHLYDNQGNDVVIISADRDLWQLIRSDGTKQVVVFDPGKKSWVNSQAVVEFFGVFPNQVRDFKALSGDPADNIPGAHGIGPKTAASLLSEYGSVPALYEPDVVSLLKKKKTTGKVLFDEDEVESAWRIVGIPPISEAKYCISDEESRSLIRQLTSHPSVDQVRVRMLVDKLGQLRTDPSVLPKRSDVLVEQPPPDAFGALSSEAVHFSKLDQEILECQRCKLRSFCDGYGPTLAEGYLDAEIMIIGRNPGADELMAGRPFVGLAGKRLDLALKEVGLTRRECYITNVCRCYSERNRAPEFTEIMACIRYLKSEIQYLKPKLIVALGNEAQAAVTPYGASGISKHCGEVVRASLGGWAGSVDCPVILFPHPSAALREQRFEMLFQFATTQLKKYLDEHAVIG